jgi:hypothetical protein
MRQPCHSARILYNTTQEDFNDTVKSAVTIPFLALFLALLLEIAPMLLCDDANRSNCAPRIGPRAVQRC